MAPEKEKNPVWSVFREKDRKYTVQNKSCLLNSEIGWGNYRK